MFYESRLIPVQLSEGVDSETIDERADEATAGLDGSEHIRIQQAVTARGKQFDPPLTEDELAFYDAVAQNESAVTEMGTSVLAGIARDLVKALRRDVTIDWVSRDDVRAKLRSTITRLLAVHGYPPDAQPAAIQLVLAQMETFAEVWSPGLER